MFNARGGSEALAEHLHNSLLNTNSSDIFSLRGSASNCNPFTIPGKFHVDYSDASNNYWQPNDARCPAPRYMSQLRSGDYSGLDWMRGKTVVLIGDSLERDHVSLFASMLGQEVEIVKGHHPLALTAETIEPSKAAELKKKDRYGRIALKGMQESTIPRMVHLEDLDFMVSNVLRPVKADSDSHFLQMINLYHFGLDQDDYWKALDQYHAPGLIEERFASQYVSRIERDRMNLLTLHSLQLPVKEKLASMGRSVDMVEIGTGMFDLARWAKQDVAASKSTVEQLSEERLQWYQERIQKFVALTEDAFPDAVKTWRGVTIAEDQAAELDYFNVGVLLAQKVCQADSCISHQDRFGHSPSSVTAYFAPNRAKQIEEEVSKLLKPFAPKSSAQAARDLTKRGAAGASSLNIHLNPWSSLVKDVPAHQLDRLHGGDLATPGAALWSDIALWHLEQGLKAKSR